MQFLARYYDGKKAAPYDSLIHVEADGLLIEIASFPAPLNWEYETVQIKERPEQGRPLIITNIKEPEARLVLSNDAFYSALTEKIPKKNKPRIFISTAWQSLCLWSALALSIMGSIYWFVPQLAEPLSRHFPRSWERQLGEYTVTILTDGKHVCENKEGQKALDKIVTTLLAASAVDVPVSIKAVQEKQANAFAAPGGQIIVYSGLINAADSPDEVAGVIAHEMGHLTKRHPTQTLLRTLGLNIIISAIFSGTGDAAKTASVANALFQLRYNRNFEREADQIATQILYNAKIDNRLSVNHHELKKKLMTYWH